MDSVIRGDRPSPFYRDRAEIGASRRDERALDENGLFVGDLAVLGVGNRQIEIVAVDIDPQRAVQINLYATADGKELGYSSSITICAISSVP